MDGPGHLLSLKVMRVSRPSPASVWQPFYSSSPSFSSHSTASMLSLQGKIPLAGYPKTLRDLSHASELLTLPASFGAINLGETFQSILCVNNEATVDIEAVALKVEMQTASSKVTVAEFGGTDFTMTAGDTLESILSREIKELGQHILACTVQYRLPPNSRPVPGSTEDVNDPSLQSFRKFYKFAVTNPLSVKTKVHIARSPSAILSLKEREKVFLEVHIENLTQEAMWFEYMRFECVDDWKVEDVESKSPFSGAMALLQPQDVRQYIYILIPTTPPSPQIPGAIVPLGRLDISWRSLFGEPGHLLTSMLSRRIPQPTLPSQQPVSALPLHLQRARSPQLSLSRPSTPPANPQRPASPRYRPLRPQSPALSQYAMVPALAISPELPCSTELGVDIVLTDIPRNSVMIGRPFSVSFRLTLSVPSAHLHRTIHLAVQRTLPSRVQVMDQTSPQLQPVASTFSPHKPRLSSEALHQSPTQGSALFLPSPFRDQHFPGAPTLVGISLVGDSLVFLPPVRLERKVVLDEPLDQSLAIRRTEAVQEFQLSFLPVQNEFMTLGGLRILLLRVDTWEGDNTDCKPVTQSEVRILREWDSIGELWF